MGDVMDKKSGRMNVSAYSAIQTVKYSWAAKASKISKKQEVFKYFTVKTNLKSPVLKNVVTKIRNSKKTYVGKLKNLENSSSATSSSTRVTKKAVLKTAAEVETALKTKLVSERSMGNKENQHLRNLQLSWPATNNRKNATQSLKKSSRRKKQRQYILVQIHIFKEKVSDFFLSH